MNDLQRIAGEYAAQGLAVIAGRPKSKEPAVAWRAFQWEGPTAIEVEAMFPAGEQLNLAIVCGAASGNLAVFDAETKNAFYDVVAHFEDAGLADTWMVETKRGGHVYCRFPEPVKPINDKVVELRSQGQYVLAPPSIHPFGSRYSFVNRSQSICKVTSLECIDWLKLEPVPRSHHLGLPRRAAQLLQGAGEGKYQSRSEMEQAIVCLLVNAGFTFGQSCDCFPPIRLQESSANFTMSIRSVLLSGFDSAFIKLENGVLKNRPRDKWHVRQ